MSVPLDWGNPDGARLPIAYELFAHRASAQPAAGMLVPLAGGPGGSGAKLGHRRVHVLVVVSQSRRIRTDPLP